MEHSGVRALLRARDENVRLLVTVPLATLLRSSCSSVAMVIRDGIIGVKHKKCTNTVLAGVITD